MTPADTPPPRSENAGRLEASRGIRSGVPGWLGRLAGLSDTPRRTAAAFAWGVFLSFSPFFGVQIALGMGMAIVLRLNRLAVFLGLCSNLPWVMVPWYAATTAAGAAVLNVPFGADFTTGLERVLELSVFGREFWIRLMDLVWPLLGAFVLGSTIGAAIVSAVVFLAVERVIIRIRARNASSE